jgi:hypothetical protein
MTPTCVHADRQPNTCSGDVFIVQFHDSLCETHLNEFASRAMSDDINAIL